MVGTLRLVLVILHTYIDTQQTGFQKNDFWAFFNCFFFKDPIDFFTWELDQWLVSL